MSINTILRYIAGNVAFSTQNGFYERLINLCAAHNIPLWDFAVKDDGFTAKCMAKDYDKVKKLAQKINITVVTEQKNGLTFQAARYRKRWGITIGVLLFFIFLFFSQFYVWDIEVSGNHTVPDTIILSELSDIGVRKRSFIPGIDFRLKRQQAMTRLPQLSWLTINQNGCRLEVKVTERHMPPVIQEETPCDIVASHAGTIKYMEVYDGDKAVAVGDTVNAGDILVHSAYTTKQGMTIYVHASAKIIADVKTNKTISVDLNQLKKRYSSKTKSRYFLDLFSVRVPLYLAIPIKGDYDVSEHTSYPTLFEQKFPVGIGALHYSFYQKEPEKLMLSKARKIIQDGFLQYESTDLSGCAILKKTTQETVKNKTLRITTSYELEKNIARQKEI